MDDDGHGLPVSPEQALDPFYTTKSGKKTGLGLSLFKAEAEAAGGALTIGASELGGAQVRVSLRLSHVDRPPLGDVATSLIVMAATNPAIDFRVSFADDRAETPLRRMSVAEAVPELTRCADELARTASRAASAARERTQDGRAAEPGRGS